MLALGAWAYVVLALAVLADSVIPLIPSELLCVAAGAFVATGRLNGWVVLPAVVIGGMLGDQATYHLGRVGSRRAVRTMTATPRRRRFFERLQGALSRRRTSTIVVARFLPGGRTGVGLLAGMTDQPRRGYAGASLLGVSVWAVYLVGAGYVAGHAVDSVWVSVGIALDADGARVDGRRGADPTRPDRAVRSHRRHTAGSARARLAAARTNARWVKACGKFPSWRSAAGSYSSENRPTSLARPARRSKRARPSSTRPCRR